MGFAKKDFHGICQIGFPWDLPNRISMGLARLGYQGRVCNSPGGVKIGSAVYGSRIWCSEVVFVGDQELPGMLRNHMFYKGFCDFLGPFRPPAGGKR